jgi:hypothetical protein
MGYLVKFGLICGLGLLVACATTKSQKNRVDPPAEWISQFNTEDIQCVDISERFQNSGERYLGNRMVAQDGLLAEMVFSRYLPGGLTSEFVEFDSDVQSGHVKVTLIGESKREMEFEIFCKLGWIMIKSFRSGQYLGDGVVEKNFEKVTFFRTGDDGELIVRVIVDAQFNSMYIFNSEVEAEGWYRFQPVSSLNN